MAKIKTCFLAISSGVICLGLLYLSFAVFIDGKLVRKPLIITSAPRTEKVIYHPGDSLNVAISFEKTRDNPCVYQYTLVNNFVTYYAPVTSLIKSGVYKDKIFKIGEIPLGLEKGKYHLEATVTYTINALNKVTINLASNEFVVKR